jgi:hypothetical protein
MLLKSDGFASNLSSPDPTHSLKAFCELRGIPYEDATEPVRLETFIEYGLWFQRHLVSELDSRRVVKIERGNANFSVQMEDGDRLEARRVVLAVGIRDFAWIPPQLESLPANFLTHSSKHQKISDFGGREVTIICSGASAIDLAALLHEQGAKVCIIARRRAISFHTPPSPTKRSFWQQVRNPSSGLGPGWRSRLCTEVPSLCRYLPANLRLWIVREHLGPSGGRPMRERVMGKIPMILGARNVTANIVGNRVHLLYLDWNCHRAEHMTDHVIAATGYRAEVSRLEFLGSSIQKQLVRFPMRRCCRLALSRPYHDFTLWVRQQRTPSVRMMRFAFGVNYTSRRLARHLQRGVLERRPKVLAYPTEALN